MSAQSEWIHHDSPGSRAGELERRKQGLTTHLSVWPAATLLVKWLEQNRTDIGLEASGAKILELGSGTGFLGCTLARNLPDAGLIQLTDLPDAVGELQQYCNKFTNQHNVKNLEACPCDWDEFRGPDAKILPRSISDSSEGWDIIVGSDLVWNRTNIKSLPLAVRAALQGGKPGCAMYYAHWQRNPWALPLLLKGFDALELRTEYMNPPLPVEVDETEQEPEPVETEDGYEWNNVIFNETKEEPPIFCIYKICLGQQRVLEARPRPTEH